MAILTNDGGVQRAKAFMDATNEDGTCFYWIAIGRTTAWTNENSPPVEDPTTHDITEIQGFRRVEHGANFTLVVPDSTGSISFLGSNYEPVTADGTTEYSVGAKYVYLKSAFITDEGGELSTDIQFRQVGLYLNTQASSGNEGKVFLTAAQVDDNGTLVFYDNISPASRNESQTDTISIIIEF